MIKGEDEIEIKKALAECNNIQSMIDLSAKRLEGLRTQCLTSAELIQHEIRTLEGKLIKLFSRYLVAKTHIPDQCIPEPLKVTPSLKQWLEVVGLSKDSVNGLFHKMSTLEYLLDRTDSEVRNILQEYKARDEEVRRLINALHNLKKYTEFQLADEKGDKATIDIELSWDSWDNTGENNFNPLSMQTSPKPRRSRATSSSEDMAYKSSSPSPKLCEDNVFKICPSPVSKVPPVSLHSNLPLPGLIGNESKFTPPPTPPAGKLGKGEKVKFPTTPPPKKKHQTQNPTVLEAFPLTKSKSHESQLAHKVDSEGSLISQLMNFVNMNPNWLNFSLEQLPRPRRGRLATEPGLESGISPFSANTSPLTASPARSPPYYNEDETFYKKSLQVPRSPHSPKYPNVSMSHFIQHRFAKLIKVTTCDYCERQMFIGLKCKECKFKCHRDCESHVPPSCGLPGGLFDAFKSLHENSPVLPRGSPLHVTHLSNKRERKKSYNQSHIHIPPFQGPDSSSNTSSCNSSTPSSPALLITSHTPPSASRSQQFIYPDPDLGSDVFIEARPIHEYISDEVHQSHDGGRAVSMSWTSNSGSTDSERTLTGQMDSQDGQISESEFLDRHWPRQNSLSLREWDIPFEELHIEEPPLGSGRFGTVHRGHWHGDVAVKLLHMDCLDDEKTIEAFKAEVATFRKTRHENLVLFMGACMKPPAIVTSMCRGMTLHTYIHLRKDKFNMNKSILIAQQISQGMGYLHARGIIHKDMKTKNIFLENGKVVITDFGLFNVTKLCHKDRKGAWLSIPPGWLCYLSPEIMRSLHAGQDADLPFTMTSDTYAFGTVWYELLCGEWPFKGNPPESIIWQVGKGMKQSLANLQASRDVKDILMTCWAYKPQERPDFSSLLKILEKLPKKRLARSPSHPVHLSRSAESVF